MFLAFACKTSRASGAEAVAAITANTARATKTLFLVLEFLIYRR